MVSFTPQQYKLVPCLTSRGVFILFLNLPMATCSLLCEFRTWSPRTDAQATNSPPLLVCLSRSDGPTRRHASGQLAEASGIFSHAIKKTALSAANCRDARAGLMSESIPRDRHWVATNGPQPCEGQVWVPTRSPVSSGTSDAFELTGSGQPTPVQVPIFTPTFCSVLGTPA